MKPIKAALDKQNKWSNAGYLDASLQAILITSIMSREAEK